MATTFNGFKQVTLDYYNSVSPEERKGYLWLVRSNISGDSYTSDIYFGNKQYAHFGTEVEDLSEAINNILIDAGIIDESGQTVNVVDLINDATLVDGTAITIVNKEISVSIADETENAVDEKDTEKNFLKVNSDNKLEVNGVDADAAVTSEDIPIAGGPLADLVLAAYPEGFLPSGTSVQDFFKALLCVEIWGNPVVNYTFTATAAKPTIAKTGYSAYLPVGSEMAVSATEGVATATEKAVASGFGESGYKYRGEIHKSDSFTVNGEATSEGDYVLSAAFSGFKENGESGFVDASSNNGEPKTVYVANGSNIYTVNESGLTFRPSAFMDIDLFDVSNLGNVSTNPTTISNDGFMASSAYAESKTPSSNNSLSVTGYYPIYYGTLAKTSAVESDITEESILSFGNGNRTVPSGVTTSAGTGTFVIAVPQGNSAYSKTEVVLKDSKDMEFGACTTFTTNIEMLNGFERKNYKVFFITNANATTSVANWSLTFN